MPREPRTQIVLGVERALFAAGCSLCQNAALGGQRRSVLDLIHASGLLRYTRLRSRYTRLPAFHT